MLETKGVFSEQEYRGGTLTIYEATFHQDGKDRPYYTGDFWGPTKEDPNRVNQLTVGPILIPDRKNVDWVIKHYLEPHLQPED